MSVTSPERRTAILLIGAALLALAFLQATTVHGIGVEEDSVQYLSAADHLLRGQGLRVHWWDPGSQPFTHFPPGLVFGLAALQRLGRSAEAAAWWLNGAALVALTLISARLAQRAAPHSGHAGLFGGAAVLLSRDILAVHAMIWSEPLFLALSMGALLATVRSIETDATRPALVTGLLAGAAGLTRYVAPTVIGACVLSLAILGAAPMARRLRRAAVVAVLSAAPLAAIIAWNARHGGSATNRELVYHPMSADHLLSAARTVYHWFIPDGGWVEPAMLVAVGLAVVWVGAAWRRSRARPSFRATPVAGIVLVLFAMGYVAFLALSLTFVDAQSTPDERMLVPLVPVAAVLVVAVIAEGLGRAERRRASAALGVLLVVAALVSVGAWASDTSRMGLGYSGPAWRESRLLARVRDLPPAAVIVSNHPAAIWYLLGREVVGVPRLANPNTMRPIPAFPERMAVVCHQADGGAFYAHFTSRPPAWFLPSLSETRRHWRSRPTVVAADGVVDSIPAGCR